MDFSGIFSNSGAAHLFLIGLLVKILKFIERNPFSAISLLGSRNINDGLVVFY